MATKKKQPSGRCNICGLPDWVIYYEEDPESHKRVEKKQYVPCLGHVGIHPSLWNKAAVSLENGMRSLGFDDYEKYRIRKKSNS